MRLELKRKWLTREATVGELFINGQFECFILEDQTREIPGIPVEQWKVKGKTAIPVGRYRVVITFSNRFKRDLPLLENVPGFAGIRIHPGNKAVDTEGCLLPGLDRKINEVQRSRIAFDELFRKIAGAEGQVWIEITNEP